MKNTMPTKPAGSVEHHDDAALGMAISDLVEKYLHAVRIDVRQDQAVQFAAYHIDRTVRIGVLMGQHGPAQRAHRQRRPATTHVIDPSKTRLVLEHQLDRTRPWPGGDEVG